MDEEYDVVVCGTGLKECILAGLLASEGNKVLQVDRNDYYGGDTASLNLTKLFKKFTGSDPPKDLGSDRDWNVDLIPKFIMASGDLVKMLLHTNVAAYLEWKSVAGGTYVYQYQEAGFFSEEKFIHKVPQTAEEALKSSLMSLLEKNRFRQFFNYLNAFKEGKPDTYGGMDPYKTSMKQVYEKFGLEAGTIDFLGHCVACHTSDDYLKQAAVITLRKMKLYWESISKFGKSPFIYPLYGLGTMSEGFARFSAIKGSTYMLKTPVDGFEFGADGQVCGVKSGGQTAKCKKVVCDPSYVVQQPNKVRPVGEVIRMICILNRPIPNTNDAGAVQIILTASEMKRKNDIYVLMCSQENGVCGAGKYIAIISTKVETSNPEKELEPALKLIGGRPLHKFSAKSTLFEPCDDGKKDGIFVTQSYDPTCHFELTSLDVMHVWERMYGKKLELKDNSQ